MKTLNRILAAGLTGTAFMTLHSYVLGMAVEEDFSEPEHLGTMIHRLSGLTKKASRMAGWNAHFAVGLGFAGAYLALWQRGAVRPTYKNAVALGLLSGLLAVAIWKLTLKMHPLPPWINYNKYYLQLIPAHVVFAVFATVAYRLTTAAADQGN
jgi:hypothetical protein